MQNNKKIQELIKKKFKDLKDVNQYLKQFSKEIIEAMLETIKILNEFVFMKVDELSNPQDQKQLSDFHFQQNEISN